MPKDYGKNLKWFLGDISNADADQFEFGGGDIEVYGETESGEDCSCTVDVRELCGAALERIKLLEEAMQEIIDLSACRQDEGNGIAMAAMDEE